MPPAVSSETNIDVICAKAHARRAAIYEKERLARLCELRGFSNLVAEVFPEEGIEDHRQFQKRLTEDHLSQVTWILKYLGGRPYELFSWLLQRYRIENLKVIFRGFHARLGPQEVGRHLIATPDQPPLPVEEMVGAANPDEFAELVPDHALGAMVTRSMESYKKNKKPFFFEAAVDGLFYSRLLSIADEPSLEDLSGCLPMLALEADIYLLMLVLRAKLNYGVDFSEIEPFVHIRGAVRVEALNAICAAGGLSEAIGSLPKNLARAIGENIETIGELERALRAYFHTQVNAAFYASGISLAVAVAFYYLKRIELENLIRLSEGYRYGLSAAEMRRCLVPPAE